MLPRPILVASHRHLVMSKALLPSLLLPLFHRQHHHHYQQSHQNRRNHRKQLLIMRLHQ